MKNENSIEAVCAAIAKAVNKDTSLLIKSQKPSKGSDLREKLKTNFIVKKPKHIYVVLNTRRDTGPQIVGCFYGKKAAEQWAGNSNTVVVHKLAVA